MKKKHSKLRWNIHSLQEGKNTFHLTLSPEDLLLDPEKTRIKGPIECAITLMRNGTKVILEGEATFSLVLECARCSEEFILNEREAMTAYFLAKENDYNDAEGLSQEDMLSEQYSDDTIDALQLVLDTIELAKPMKPLCSESCKGLCPICGQNLNTGKCTCKKDTTDPRWDALKKLMK